MKSSVWCRCHNLSYCLPPHGGSGLKSPSHQILINLRLRLPPHGGSGLKFEGNTVPLWKVGMSPSPRREWIEIHVENNRKRTTGCLPPHGGSGLKWRDGLNYSLNHLSPSPRREWIEMKMMSMKAYLILVSLPTEGVD